jgi:hypothetical protein
MSPNAPRLYRGCCGVPVPHAHLCELGPLGYLVFRLADWLRNR